jgi:Lon protease-like protein
MRTDVASYPPGSVLECVPMFPLPGVVLFPKTLLPLHIFEPRYRAMTEAALQGSREIVMGCITGGSAGDAASTPAVFSIAGLGEIVQCERLADGRFNIVLVGRARVRIHELPFLPPYRRVRAEVLGETDTRASESDVAALVSSATRLCASMRRADPAHELRLPSDDPGALADACAHQLVIDADERQRLLETLDTRERLRSVTEILAVQHALLEAKQGAAN